MSWTRADAIRQTLSNLGALGNDTPSDEDSQKVDRIIDPVVESLSRRSKYTFSDVGSLGPADGAIEDEGALDLCHCLAWAAAPSFGQLNDPALKALKEEAENNLEIIAAPPRSRRVLSMDVGALPRRRFGTYDGT